MKINSKSSKLLSFLCLFIILILLFGGLFIYFNALYEIFTNGFGGSFDDAYMFTRYSQNLLNGYGFTWNAGMSSTYGPTSIPYVFIVTLFMRFVPLESNFLMPTISWIIGLMVLALLGNAALTQTRKLSLPIATVALGCVAWVAISPFFIYHATTGMDTTFSMLANTLLALAWIKLSDKRGVKRAFILALTAYLSFAIRPDNIIYAFGFPVLALLVIESPSQWREALLFLGFFSGLIIADTFLKIRIFGDPLPLSYYVKQHNFYQGYLGESKWNPITYLSIFIIGVIPSGIVLLSSLRRIHTKLAVAFLAPVALTFAYYFSVLQIMGQYARYYYPASPFVIILSILVMRDLNTLPAWAEFKKASWRLILSILSLISVLLFLTTTGQNLYSVYVFGAPTLSGEEAAANSPGSNIQKLGWGRAILAITPLIKQLPNGTIIAASEVGYIGAKASQVEIIDMIGLNDPIIAHNGFNATELLARKPDLIWMPHADYALIRLNIECNPDLYAKYTYYPNFFDYGIAVRKNGQHTNSITNLLSESLESVYPNLKVPLDDLAKNELPAYCIVSNIPTSDPNIISHPTRLP